MPQLSPVHQHRLRLRHLESCATAASSGRPLAARARSILLALPALLAPAGCAQPYPSLEGQDTEGAELPVDQEAFGRGSQAPVPAPDAPCVESEVTGPLPIVIATNTQGQGHDFEPTCAQAGDDVAFLWTAPHAGYFTFSTQGSAIDTVLSAHSPQCGGKQLACNDNAGAGPAPGADQVLWSDLAWRMYEGQVVALSVAGVGDDLGPVRLTIDELRCPDAQPLQGALPLEVHGVSSGPSAVHGSCGGATGGEAVYAWTAPYDGVFLASTQGSAADTVLYAFDESCPGGELVCADDSLETLQSDILLTMRQGETVQIVVDTWAPTQATHVLTLRDAQLP